MGMVLGFGHAMAFIGTELEDEQRRALDAAWQEIAAAEKGPYTRNHCVCTDGTKAPVMDAKGQIRNPCAKTKFCAAFRDERAEPLARQGMYVGNIFASDLHDWERIPDHDNLVRGFILEKYFTDNHPEHQLGQLKAYGGLSGAEYEARDMPKFFEAFLALPDYNDSRHYILAFELQRRYFVRNDWGGITEVRNLANRIHSLDPDFKPLRDATHNQVSAVLIPRLAAYRDALPESKQKERGAIGELISAIEKLTALDESALKPQIGGIEDKALRERLSGLLPAKDASGVERLASLGELMRTARDAVAAGEVSPADRRRLVDLNVTAGAVIQSIGSALLDEGSVGTVADHLRVLVALADGAYGAGLLSARELEAGKGQIAAMLAAEQSDGETFRHQLKKAERVVEWGHTGALLAFAEVWAPWTHLLPDVAHIGDDIVRASPLLLFARVSGRLEDHVAGDDPIRHHLFGQEITSGVRALNPGLARAVLRVAPPAGGYSRDQIVALPETPADLEPAAGILTRGEGNVVSHVQLLARALGIPNLVLSPEAYGLVEAHDGEEVLLAVTPGGRVILKAASAMDETDRAAYEEYNRNTERSGDGALAGGADKLHIDKERIDLNNDVPLALDNVRRDDSGVRTGPKAAFLGELKHLFPERVSRGIVVPFGAFREHFDHAEVVLPENLADPSIAEAGEPLLDFAKRTYATFFDEMIPGGTSQEALSAWIRPRLDIIRHSIEATPVGEDLERAIGSQLDAAGLLDPANKTNTVGCFVRSDTNVEDLDNFNGAGLNLTLFNLKSVHDIFDGLKQVWASPFTYRSFSWRQTLIDEPLWVLPSVLLLESVPSEKSGVLVTADIDTGDPSKMLVATSEGVGGAVDGTPAETLLWSEDGVELVTQFKSPTRRLLSADGGSEIVPATGSDRVLSEAELDELISVAKTIVDKLEPAKDPQGRPRPWDIEYGFVDGKLYLFQVRPFIGNEDMANMPALTALDGPASAAAERKIQLDDEVNP